MEPQVGVEDPKEVAAASLAEFERFYSVNVKGTLLCLRAVSAAMKEQKIKSIMGRSGLRDVGRGVIINLGSCNSYVATPNIIQYTSSKHAILGMTRNAGTSFAAFSSNLQYTATHFANLLKALDNAPHHIRVNAICPSWVDTPMVKKAVAGDPKLAEMMTKIVPMNRIARPEEISDVILFLSSPRSSYVTGAGWLVDGGTTLQVQT